MGYIEDLRQYVGTKPLMLPGSIVIIVNEEGHILLQERHNHAWGLPGGIMELGESCEETARREVLEETGLTIGELELIHLLSGKDGYVVCPNGDEVYSITAVYVTHSFSGTLDIDYSESLDMHFFALDDLPDNISLTAFQAITAYRKKL